LTIQLAHIFIITFAGESLSMKYLRN